MEKIASPPALSKKQWLLILGAALGLLLTNKLIEQLLNKEMLNSMKNESSSFILTAAALFFNGMWILWAQSVVLTSILQPLHPQTSTTTIAIKLGDFTKEWLRALGNASLWMFALVVPGLLRLVDYTFLPFVCFFDSDYQNGTVDALERCRSLAKGFRGKLWAMWIGFGIILPALNTTLFSDYESFAEFPGLATLVVTIEALFEAFSFWLFWRLYWKASHTPRL